MYYNRKIALYTLGCKLNFSETSSIAHALIDYGYERVDFSDLADFYIINTCSVTENADKKCRAVVRQSLNRNPMAKIIIIGCYAQLKPKEIARIPGVSLVLGASEKFRLHTHLDLLSNKLHTLQTGRYITQDIKTVNAFKPAFSRSERTRTFLKIQDGCDYFCTFCTIPLARGKSRSGSISDTLLKAKKAAETGVKEIVLTGVNTGDFGKSTEGKQRLGESFFELIKELDKIPSIRRWRISSIEPNLLSKSIIQFVSQSDKFMPHFHIPLQSGSDALLSLMKRKYNTDLYTSRIAYIKERIPHCSIGVDVIVGFPGETEKRFMETVSLINKLDVSYLHVFTYSERANTRALKISPIVPMHIRRERSKTLRKLSIDKKHHFYTQYKDTLQEVLVESENDPTATHMYGFTKNYIKVRLPIDNKKANTLQMVKINDISNFGYANGIYV